MNLETIKWKVWYKVMDLIKPMSKEDAPFYFKLYWKLTDMYQMVYLKLFPRKVELLDTETPELKTTTIKVLPKGQVVSKEQPSDKNNPYSTSGKYYTFSNRGIRYAKL